MTTKKDEFKFGDIVHQPPELTAFPKLKQRTSLHTAHLTIPANVKTKSGVTEKDRNEVIERYRLMKRQGKFQ